MEEKMRIRLLIAAVITNIILLLILFSSCNKAAQYQKARVKEMDMRLDREKQLADMERQKVSCQTQLQQLITENSQLKEQLETTKKLLMQEQLVSASLKEELLKINKAKLALEEEVKSMMAGSVKTTEKGKK
ncbi:MAG: hypothetical protein N2606_06375 [Candidatus Omnitrophica bacterium]|nr:hypothetical protein [Candidatus Omnitrophota bacterium]